MHSNIAMIKDSYHRVLNDMVRNNDHASAVILRKQVLDREYSECRSLVRNLKLLRTQLENKNSIYIDDIITMLEEAVGYAVNAVLPEKSYNVSLDYKAHRNDGTLKLYLIDDEGRKLPPKIIEGDMLNQVLSFGSIVHISISRGYKTIYYDEAFASANIRSLVLINSVIKYYMDRGVKFVLVSQNPVLYSGLDRKMVELVSDGKQVVAIKETYVEPGGIEAPLVVQIQELFDSITQGK